MFIKNYIKPFFLILFFLIGLFASFLIYIFYNVEFKLLLVPKDKYYHISLMIYDDVGESLGDVFDFNHETIYYKDLPQNIIKAFVAAEDHRFFEHRGISFRGIIRSIVVNLWKRRLAQGGSTITQQVVRLTLGDLKKNIIRKIKEQFYAILVEATYSKEEIFESYINIAYFGRGVFGIGAAAEYYFGKNISELSVTEACVLAGILPSPERYSPQHNFQMALSQRNSVLLKMKKCKFITEEEYKKALEEPLIIKEHYNLHELMHIKNTIYDFFLEHQSLFNKYKTYHIYTTFNKKIQEQFIQKIHKGLNFTQKKYKDIEMGGLLINSYTGELKAIAVGYKNIFLDSFNHAFYAKRQVGSVIKPLVLYYALQKGDSVDTTYKDSPITEIRGWNPRNYNRKYSNEDISLKDALIKSNNIIPIQILLKYGLPDFKELLHTLNLSKDIETYYSSALGCIDQSPRDIALYLASFVNEGFLPSLCCVNKIIDDENNIIYRHSASSIKKIVDTKITKKIREIMIETGTYLQHKKNILPIKQIGIKTGTAQKVTSCWTMGFNEVGLVGVLYIGDEKNKSMEKYGVRSYVDVFPIIQDIL